MFGLKFLPTEKRKYLEKLQVQLAGAKTTRLRNEAELAIQEIESQAKVYTECDLVEADDLRSQLYQRISILTGLGKGASAEVFQMHLKDVEFHIQTLQMAAILKEKNKVVDSDEPPNLSDKTPTITSMRKEKKKKQTFGLPRWTIDFNDEPTDK